MNIQWIKDNTFKCLGERVIFKLLSRDQVVYKVDQYPELTGEKHHKQKPNSFLGVLGLQWSSNSGHLVISVTFINLHIS